MCDHKEIKSLRLVLRSDYKSSGNNNNPTFMLNIQNDFLNYKKCRVHIENFVMTINDLDEAGQEQILVCNLISSSQPASRDSFKASTEAVAGSTKMLFAVSPQLQSTQAANAGVRPNSLSYQSQVPIEIGNVITNEIQLTITNDQNALATLTNSKYVLVLKLEYFN